MDFGFNIIKDETDDQIILANDLENVIVSLICFIIGLFVMWIFFKDFITAIFNYSNTSNSLITILVEGLFMAYGGLFIWIAFERMLVKSKAMIHKKHQKIIIERKSIIKYLESMREIWLGSIIEIEIIHKTSFEGINSWNIHLVVNTEKSKFFFSSSSESETKKLADKICKLINPQIPIRESEIYI